MENMIVVNVEQYEDRQNRKQFARFYLTLRSGINSQDPSTFSENLFVSEVDYVSAQEAKQGAEKLFGLLDWGRAGQPDRQACCGVDY